MKPGARIQVDPGIVDAEPWLERQERLHAEYRAAYRRAQSQRIAVACFLLLVAIAALALLGGTR